ncbi:MAG: chromosome segregation protein SMC [Candidatus Binataceae bacterium]
MRLKSLELLGFKSFLEPTTISFAPGVTAVVGPNGCGKSNVVDAIRWVLGEQAPTRLRGKSAEDLIYAGNDSNPAAGLAEVTLVLEADENAPFPEPFEALSELAVTRRVYRSSDSEYLLNKIPCRLKDITEFFMASQIHSRGYALIEQGRIEEIIQAKPEEIRGFIEEAAGLSLFKGRRDMSERKLDRVRENLDRLNDVLAEIDRQLNYARRQAKKAEVYRQLRAELDALERICAARRLIGEREACAAQSAREGELKQRAEAARTRSRAAQAALEAASQAMQALLAELAGADRELQSLGAGGAERSRTREFLERRLRSMDELEPGLRTRLAELESKANLARAARADTGARLARQSRDNGDGGEMALQSIQARQVKAQRELNAVEQRGEDLKDEVSEIVREAAVVRGRLGDLAGERAELEERISQIDARTPQLRAARDDVSRRLASAEAQMAALRDASVAAEQAEREAAQRQTESRGAVERLAARLAVLRDIATDNGAHLHASRLETAERLRSVLESLNGDRPAADPAIVHDVVRAPAELQPALRAVLGEEFDAVIVDSPQFALRAIEVLKQTHAGRLGFVPHPDVAAAAHPAIDAPGIAGRLLDMIEVEPGFAPIAEAMLGRVMLADDLKCALAASNLNGQGTLFVTRDGDLLVPGRMLSGGSAANHGGARSPDNGAPAQEHPDDFTRIELEFRAATDRFAQCRSADERASIVYADSRTSIAARERIATELRAEAAREEQSWALAHAQSADARRRHVDLAEQATVANARLQELARTEHDARERLAALRGEIEAQRQAASRLGDALLDVASRVEARKSELGALEQAWRHAENTARDLESQIDEHQRARERSHGERDEFHGELRKLAVQEEGARARESELRASLVKLRAQCAQGESELADRRTEADAAREALESLENDAMECRLSAERARTLADELARSFAEKFHAAFESVESELRAALDGRESARDDERLGDLRARAERIGEVNLAAESEVKELDERHAILSRERDDLSAAMLDLTQTITRLNREARKRFAETFEGAAKHFAQLCPKLLRGGRGHLELGEAGDLLNAGVNVLVQPAGKKVKELALLSGGEKALAAMALVFSLFLLNPSPFCVMDEVDAPLDEFSLAAFVSLLDELKARSQFIVITHNQRTMQRADHIHGITMDRPGISRVISLKIPQAA